MVINDVKNYHNIPLYGINTKLNQDIYSKIPIKENWKNNIEKLVDLREIGIAWYNYYHLGRNPPYYHSIPWSIPYLLIREGIANKLININSLLEVIWLELYLFDAYRPIKVQNYFYLNWVPKYLKNKYTFKNEEWINKEVKKYWSRWVQDNNELKDNIPPHSTGAAVDLTLRDKTTGILLEMGTIFDDTTKYSHIDYFEKKDLSKMNFSEEVALSNRRILFHAMSSEWFAYHPREWWHYSFGDQIWAYINKEENAIYWYAWYIYEEYCQKNNK